MSDTNYAADHVGQPSNDDLLQSFEQKVQVIRDRVASVVRAGRHRQSVQERSGRADSLGRTGREAGRASGRHLQVGGC